MQRNHGSLLALPYVVQITSSTVRRKIVDVALWCVFLSCACTTALPKKNNFAGSQYLEPYFHSYTLLDHFLSRWPDTLSVFKRLLQNSLGLGIYVRCTWYVLKGCPTRDTTFNIFPAFNISTRTEASTVPRPNIRCYQPARALYYVGTTQA